MCNNNQVNSDCIEDISNDLLSISIGDDITEIVNETYQELIEIIGTEATLKIYQHYRGCRIDLPKYFYRVEYIVNLAAQKKNRRERNRISVLSGYTADWIERKVKEYCSQTHKF